MAKEKSYLKYQRYHDEKMRPRSRCSIIKSVLLGDPRKREKAIPVLKRFKITIMDY